jgi:hypothetical protein
MGDVGENATLEMVRLWIIKPVIFPESVFSIPELLSFEIPDQKFVYPVRRRKFL